MSQKVSILMPTYNDADTLSEALESIVNQDYQNWELIIINDGSTDRTEEVVKLFNQKYNLKNQLIYIYQDNADQLRAILNGAKKITGDIVTLLHSDDLFYDDQVLTRIANYDFAGVDAILANLMAVDGHLEPINEVKMSPFDHSSDILARTLLMYGRQQYSDSFIATKEYFIKQITVNYLTWNIPFYIPIKAGYKLGRVEIADFIDRKYRVHADNYINNEVGKLNVVNGELRTAAVLMSRLNIPFYFTQSILARITNKLKLPYRIHYSKTPTRRPDRVIATILDRRFERKYWQQNLFLNSLYGFFANQCERTIELAVPKDEFIFLGCDMRRFNNQILSNDLSSFYKKILNEMERGFSVIKCSQEDKLELENIVCFLCISNFIKIEVAG